MRSSWTEDALPASTLRSTTIRAFSGGRCQPSSHGFQSAVVSEVLETIVGDLHRHAPDLDPFVADLAPLPPGRRGRFPACFEIPGEPSFLIPPKCRQVLSESEGKPFE